MSERVYEGTKRIRNAEGGMRSADPTKGVVVARGGERGSLAQPSRRLHTQKPGVKTFVFYAGPKVPEGLVVV